MYSAVKDNELPEEGEILESPHRSLLYLSPWDFSSSSDELLGRASTDEESLHDDLGEQSPSEEQYDSVKPCPMLLTATESNLVENTASRSVKALHPPIPPRFLEFENQDRSPCQPNNAPAETIDSNRFSPEELSTLPETELVVRERGIEVEILRLKDLLLAIHQERQRRLLDELREAYPPGSRLTCTNGPLQFCANRIWAQELALMVDARRQSEMLADQAAGNDGRTSQNISTELPTRSDGGSSGSIGMADNGSPTESLNKQDQAHETANDLVKDMTEFEEKPPPPPPGRPRVLYTMDAINGLVYEIVEVDVSGAPALTPSGLQDPSEAKYVFGQDEETNSFVLLENVTHLFAKFPYLNRKREA